MRDRAQMLEAMKSGGGVLFIGTKNVVETDPNNRVTAKRLGPVKQDDGFDWEFVQEPFIHKVGEPFMPGKVELAELGLKVSFNLQEVHTITSLATILSGATASETSASASVSFTNLQVTLYDYNIQDLPYHDVTITSISTDDATPTTYTGVQITTNFVIDSAKGQIGIKSTGSVETDPLGVTFYLTGTWSRPEQAKLSVGAQDGGEMDYYTLWFIAEKEGRRTQILFIPKVSVTAVKTIPYKGKTARVAGLDFTAVFDPSATYLYDIIDENPPLT